MLSTIEMVVKKPVPSLGGSQFFIKLQASRKKGKDEKARITTQVSGFRAFNVNKNQLFYPSFVCMRFISLDRYQNIGEGGTVTLRGCF